MGGLPTGVVTFLFTDIEGSSHLWREHPQQMTRALEQHDRILRSAIGEHGGYVFTTAGDSFAAAFGRAGDALAAAVAAQRRMQVNVWPDPVVIRVRMGLHSGKAQERDGDYFGDTVNTAARVMSAGHGGQVLVSDVVRAAAEDVEYLELGLAELKGVAPVRLSQVLADDLESVFPPAKGILERSHSLPRLGSPTVGRHDELSRIATALGAHDVVTLTGVGGCGKTRLAIEAGRNWIEDKRQSVWFADLAAVGDGDALWSAVADSMLLDPEPNRDPRQAVLAALNRRPVLLILDNCEHLLDPASDLVDEILATSPGVSLLCTSREALAVEGEQVVRVPSLDVGSDGAGVDLFVTRVRVRDQLADFDATERDTIARICAALDGLPLAIELAASRADVMTLDEIESQLADRFAFLGGHRRRGRARTLSATLDWSYDLLPDGERRVFERLAVFQGGFNLDAATAVCELSPAQGVDVLQRLVDQSLIEPLRHRSGRRFRMLETVRQYAEGRLTDRSDARLANERHLAWVTTLVQRHETLMGEDRHLEALAVIDDDQHNLRAAMDWAAAGGAAQVGLDLFMGSEGWWRHTMNIREALERAIGLYERCEDELDPATSVQVKLQMAFFTTYLSDRSELGEELVADARAAVLEVPDEVQRLKLRITSNITRIGTPDPEVGAELEELLSEARRLGTDDDLQLLHFLSVWYLDQDLDRSLRLAIECQHESALRGNAVSTAHGHEVLANAQTATGDLTAARTHLQQALRGYLDTKHLGCGMHCLESIAWWAAAGRVMGDARRLLGLAAGVRRSHQRQLHWLESYPHRAAIESCGAPDPHGSEDADLDQAVDLALRLLEADHQPTG